MLTAPVVKDFAQTVMLPGDAPPATVARAVQPLVKRARSELRSDGVAPQEIVIERLLDMRYAGQSYELPVPLPEGDLAGFDLRGAFQRVHERAYGYTRPEGALEIVNARVRGTGRVPSPSLAPAAVEGPDPGRALIGKRPVVLGTGPAGAAHKEDLPFYRYELLRPGNRLDGPAVVVRSDTTLLLGPGDRATVDAYENLIVTCGQPDSGF
jgi:N-methylhydantoinase A